MAHGNSETEIKLALANAAAGRRLLRGAGFQVSRRRVFEANTVLDTATIGIRRSGRLLRLRQAGGVATLTFKGVSESGGRHKVRQEVETIVEEPKSLLEIFALLGFEPVFRYEKYRTEFRPGAGPGTAMLDETPVGVYLELEGSGSWIDRTARKLGFTHADYITKSYGQLYLEWCVRNALDPSNMVFS